MKPTFSFLLSLPLLFSVSSQALAAATPEEAARIASAFQTYLTAEAGVVKVAPVGDDYTVTIDIAPLIAKAADKTATLTMTPITMKLTSQGGGKWEVSNSGPFNFSLKAGAAVSADMKTEDYSWQGVFDEALGTFSQSSGELKNLTLTENLEDPSQGKTDVLVTVKGLKVEQTATANAKGGVDATANYTFDSLSETISSPGSAASSIPPMNIVFNAASGEYNSTATNMKNKSVLNLVAFFVSHTSKELILKDQANLKAMLSEALPIFENAQGSTTFKAVSIVSPVGPIAMDTLTVGVEMNGLVKDGKFRESISLAGLSIPPAIVPPWATSLVPKDITFDFGASNFNLESPAQMILAAIDFAKDPPLPDGFEATLLPSLLPSGAATISLNPTSISNDLYFFSAEGSMTAGPAALPAGKATVTAKGLDEVMKAIQAAPPEAGVGSGVGIIVAAKGMAKADADGTLKWDVESTGDGKVLINGIDPLKMQ